MHALRLAHTALVPDGLLLVLHPFSAEPVVEANGVALGVLDAHEFAGTVRAAEAGLARTVANGLFAPDHESRVDVFEHFADADAFLEIVGDWQGTTIPPGVESAVQQVPPPIAVRQPLTLMVLRSIA